MSDFNYKKTINESAILQSLLYDLDLLPEQLDKPSHDWDRMLLICVHFDQLSAERDKFKEDYEVSFAEWQTAVKATEDLKAERDTLKAQLQDARNLWNFAPEDDHGQWIQVMNDALHNQGESKILKARCEIAESNLAKQMESELAELSELKARCEKLEGYTTHGFDCDMHRPLSNHICTCGLDELRKQGEVG